MPLKAREAINARMLRGDRVSDIQRWAVASFPGIGLEKLLPDNFYQHRRRHVRPVERAARKLSDADRMVRKQIRLAKDVLEDKIDPQAYFGAASLANDIHKTEQRLDVAADQAFLAHQHVSLAQLSNGLLRSAELRGKLGGLLERQQELNITVSLGELHQRLDEVLPLPPADRQNAARALLGMAPMPISSAANADAFVQPPGSPIIEHEPAAGRSDEPAAPAASSEEPAPHVRSHTHTPMHEEPRGTRWQR